MKIINLLLIILNTGFMVLANVPMRRPGDITETNYKGIIIAIGACGGIILFTIVVVILGTWLIIRNQKNKR